MLKETLKNIRTFLYTIELLFANTPIKYFSGVEPSPSKYEAIMFIKCTYRYLENLEFTVYFNPRKKLNLSSDDLLLLLHPLYGLPDVNDS